MFENDEVGNEFGKSLFGIEGKLMCSKLLPVNLHFSIWSLEE
jgi:hypothetical protein